jgi:molybdate transport system substrate-binding protein
MTTPGYSQVLTVLASNSQRGLLTVLSPDFQQGLGVQLNVSYDPAQVMLRRIANGESADVAILGRSAIDTLIELGKIDRASLRLLARCGSGIAVKSGAAKPDIRSVDALKHSLLAVKSLIFTSEGASGMHFSRVIEELGIAAEIRAKAHQQTGGLVATRVASGEVELAVQQIPELLAVPGVDLVGPLPEPVQAYSMVTGGVFLSSQSRTAAQALLDLLITPEATRVMRSLGLEPLTDLEPA